GVPAWLQPPAFDYVAEQVQRLRVVIPQKSKESVGVRKFAAEMHVAHEDRPDALHHVLDIDSGRRRVLRQTTTRAVPWRSFSVLSLAARTVAGECEVFANAAGIRRESATRNLHVALTDPQAPRIQPWGLPRASSVTRAR